MRPGQFQGFVVLLAAVLRGSVAHASSITYEVNRVVGSAGVTGFIETDGVMGVLFSSDLLDWNLMLNNGSATIDLTGPLSGNNSAISPEPSTSVLLLTGLGLGLRGRQTMRKFA